MGWLLAGSTLTFSLGCATFDGERRAPERLSLGDELYGVMCDRLGASILTEDLEGRSFQDVCHAATDGTYADAVDVSVLPPVGGAQAITRALALSKFDALVRRRADVVAALNATFPDTEFTHPLDTEKVIGGHEALSTFLKSIAPLHETNPADPGGEALFPSVTRSAGRLLAGLAGPDFENPITDFIDELRADSARRALAGIAGRQGYRPLTFALGAISPALSYPDLRTFIQTLSPQFGRDGALRKSLQDVLAMTEYELQTSELADSRLAAYSTHETLLQPNRARTKLEIGAAALLGSDDAFRTFGAEERFLAERDHRGVVIPAQSTPGVSGTLPAPFADVNGDGFADVDDFGRFLNNTGKLANVDQPFKLPTSTKIGNFDLLGRAIATSGEPLYEYLDTSRTLAAAVIRDLGPLIAPRGSSNEAADRGDTVADLLRGAHVLYGDTATHPAPWGGTFEGYDTTDAASAPLVDLIHAAGQLLAHPRSDSWIAMIKKLGIEEEQKLARVIAGALELKEISDAHPEASLDPSVTFWDEFGEILVKLSKNPTLFKDVLRAIADPNIQEYLGSAFAKYNSYVDLMSYDPNDINGPPRNMKTHGPDAVEPVDRTQPDTGFNRSEWQRFAQIIHDMNGVNACNKQGAKITFKMLGINVGSLLGSFDECDLFVFDDIGLLYLEALLDEQYGRQDDPKGALAIQDGVVSALGRIMNSIPLLNNLLNMAKIFGDASGIEGFSNGPVIDGKAALIATPRAFNRLVFFGAASDKYDQYFPGSAMPDRDPLAGGANGGTDEFIRNILDPVPTSSCPTRNVGGRNLQDCSPNVTHQSGLLAGQPGRPEDVLRLRGQGVIFTWEMHNFYQGIAPLLKPFSDHGEGQLFVDMVEVLYRHWATDAQRGECNSNGTWRKGQPDYNPYYCAGSGVSHYEPIMAEALETTDLLASLGELITVIDGMEIVDARAFNANTGTRQAETRKGLDIVHEIVVGLMDRDYAAAAGIKDRFGNSSGAYSDGTVPPDLDGPLQITTFDLLANALKGIDSKFVGSDRLSGWRRARSNIVNTLLAVEGEGEEARFVNPQPSAAPAALPKALPILLDVLREQINAHCPEREAGVPCTWASEDLAKNAAATIEEPTFGTVMTLLDKAFSDDGLRSELAKFLHYLLLRASEDDVRHATLASLADLFQLLGDDTRMPALYWAAAFAATPGESEKPGTVDRVLELIEVVTKEAVVDGQPTENPYDPYGVLDSILSNLVSPIDPLDDQSPTPLGVLLDTIAEVNRFDASVSQDEPLDADDYRLVFATVRDFLTSETRGMEQFYEIIHHRNGD